MANPAADLERNRVHRDIEHRLTDELRKANIPLPPSDWARRTRVTVAQVRRAIPQLLADHKIREIWDEHRDTEAYVLNNPA